MAVLPLRFEGDPVLRAKAKPVAKVTKRIQKLLRDMEETMYAADGVGLAAPQIGVLERLIVVDAGDGPIHIVNPVLEHGEGSEIDREGCLSIPGVYGYVDRYARVVVSGLDPKGKPIWIDGQGLLARVLQHEIDHLDGILFIDKATGVSRVTADDGENAGEEEFTPEDPGETTAHQAGDEG